MALSLTKRKGFLYTFQSLQVMSGSELFKGLLSFKASPKLEGRKLVFGTGRLAYGRTRGQLSVECEVSWIAEGFYEWHKGHPQFLDEEFDLLAVNEEGSKRDKLEIIGLCFDSADMPQEGTDENKVTMPGMAVDLRINGQSVIFGDALGLSGDAGGTTA